MASIPVYQIDAFTSAVFSGNPAAVCPLEEWLDAETMQSIAAENNLAETAFIIAGGEGGADYGLRWFTPTVEVDLCGHATLASGYVIFNHLQPSLEQVSFSTRSGLLTVERDGDELVLDFPSRPPVPVDLPAGFEKALGLVPDAFLREDINGGKNVAVVSSSAAVRSFQPDLDFIASIPGDGIIVTARGDAGDCDFVSRYFAPQAGIPEDPVTGSAHCVTVPYWAERLGKMKLFARQVSSRGGELSCELRGDRVRMGGKGVLFLQGVITV
jgi:PhzF family phenazine biosynthesis protein